MVASHPPLTAHLSAVPSPRRPLDRVAADDDPVRRWYENELGWPTVPGTAPGSPVRLRLGLRFDVLDVPAEAGRAALRHLAGGSPVALRGDRVRLLVAAGSAEELPGILEWLEWHSLPLDLRAIGTDGSMTAPAPPGTLPGGLDGLDRLDREARRPGGPAGTARGRRPGTDDLARATPPGTSTATGTGTGTGTCESTVPGTTRPTGAAPGWVPRPTGAGERSSASGTGGLVAPSTPGRGRGAWEPSLALGHPGALQGAAVWLRPPEPGCEVEASLPTVSALGGGGGAPDLVRVVNTVATQCHRLRLRRPQP